MKMKSAAMMTILSNAALLAMGAGDPMSPPSFEYTGTVYNAITKQPIEGAYVMAIYEKSVVGPATMSFHCVKTRGMYTGKDGSFHFPIERLDGLSPHWTVAILPGFFVDRSRFPDSADWKAQNREAYSHRDLSIKPQDPAHPEYAYGSHNGFCHHAQFREDAEASTVFLRAELAEVQRYGALPNAHDALRSGIAANESRPSMATAEKPRSGTLK